MEEFYRIRRLPPYVFEEVNKAKARARNQGADIIDLGMGNIKAASGDVMQFRVIPANPVVFSTNYSRGGLTA